MNTDTEILLKDCISDIVEMLSAEGHCGKMKCRKNILKWFLDGNDDEYGLHEESFRYYADEINSLIKRIEFIKSRKIKKRLLKKIAGDVIEQQAVLNNFTGVLFYLENIGRIDFGISDIMKRNDNDDIDSSLLKSKFEIVYLYGKLSFQNGIKYILKYFRKKYC